MKDLKEVLKEFEENLNSLKNLGVDEEEISKIKDIFNDLKAELTKNEHENTSTDRQKNQTESTKTQTKKLLLRPLNHQNLVFSIGNQGVSTDRQTDQNPDKKGEIEIKKEKTFHEAEEVIDSLDNLRKNLKSKFKKMTNQETLIFSTIYQLEDEIGYANYKLISEKLNLTESSVRDHVRNLIKKEIPVDKTKIDNKRINLNISSHLKKIATLQSILEIRDL